MVDSERSKHRNKPARFSKSKTLSRESCDSGLADLLQSVVEIGATVYSLLWLLIVLFDEKLAFLFVRSSESLLPEFSSVSVVNEWL